MHKNYIILFLSIFLCGLIFADPYEQLDIEFLKKKKVLKQEVSPKSPAKNKKPDFPEYQKVIEGFAKIEGVFDFYWNKDKNKLLLSINPNQFNET